MPRQYKRRARKPGSVRGFCDDMTKNNIIKSAAKIAAKQSSGVKEADILNAAKREFGEVSDLMKLQVRKIFKDKDGKLIVSIRLLVGDG